MVNEKYEKLLNHLESAKGKVNLFAMFKMDDVVDKYTLLVGASWVNEQNGRAIFEILRKYIVENFSEEERSSIGRIGIYGLSHHLISELLQFKSGTSFTEKTKVNGNIIHEGVIIKSEV